jgi:O-antigen/teichoic acid export membrane protein
LTRSIGSRFLLAVAANAMRALVSLVSGLLIARGLSPQGYGKLTFLLGSFVAIRALLDLGSSSAFFTFISRHRRDRSFYAQYCGWLALQFGLSFVLVAVIFPQSMLEQIWLGEERGTVLIALVASFFQQQVWTTIGQIGEASRLTTRVQAMNLGIAVVHLLVICVLLSIDGMSVRLVMLAIIGELVAATVLAARLLRVPPDDSEVLVHTTLRESLREYSRFCRPLILVAIAGFVYDFADKWLLQKFGGASQQGFYQIAAQLAAVSLLATTSIMAIFWKEIAHAGAQQDQARLSSLYNRVNRGLVLVGAAIAGFLAPWAEQLIALLLGNSFAGTGPIFTLMLLYPIHQSMGQVNATMFFASERTHSWMTISILGQIATLPITFVILAPREGYVVSGLAGGALGLAVKMVCMNAVLTNVQAAFLARLNGWRFRWFWQVAVIGSLVGLGYLSHSLADWLLPAASVDRPLSLATKMAFAGALHLVGLVLLVRSFPTMVGCERRELQELARRFLPASLARLA